MVLSKKNLGNSHHASVVGGLGYVSSVKNKQYTRTFDVRLAGGIITIMELKASKTYQLFQVFFIKVVQAGLAVLISYSKSKTTPTIYKNIQI